ncbi:transposase [Extibacter muris]|uniref:transposase n=1 Tax=Extibacter muris TaxID=1796622 RepID=UPI001D06EE5E|nr:transposase [Extibacter muris]MCB6202763.1 transposase [Extibacter muris]MCQ4664441.1 transposase [Extibacter muris]MCQ4693650.1 transposase [Extibacter muris]
MGQNKYYCRIDGKVYNLKKIQDIIDENPEHPDIARIYVTAVEEYHLPSDIMIDSVITFNNNQIPADYNETLRKMQEHNKANLKKLPPKPRCPRCGSTDLWRKKGLVNADWGVYRKYYECNNCHRIFRNPV